MVDLRVTLSSARPLCVVGRLRRGSKKETGGRDNGKARKLFSLPIVHPALTTFCIQILVVQVLNETVESGKFNQKNYLGKVRLLL